MEMLREGPQSARRLLLAHGAGAPMDSPFMNAVAAALAARGVATLRFEFPYMAARRQGGPRRPPDRQPVLLEAWHEALRAAGPPLPAIGGKSLGGRMASLIADGMGVPALVCLGFPFHAPGKPPGERIAHLAGLATPALLVQGTRDPFGTAEDVAGYALSAAIRLHWVADGDHDLKPRRGFGMHAAAIDSAASAIAAFLAETLPQDGR